MKGPIEMCPCCKGRGYQKGKLIGSEIPCTRCKGTGRVRSTAA